MAEGPKFGEAIFGTSRFGIPDPKHYEQSAADSLGLADALARAVRLSGQDVLALADALQRHASAGLTDTVLAVDALAKAARAIAEDSIALGDEAWRGQALAWADTLALADTVTTLMALSRTTDLGVVDSIRANTSSRLEDRLALESAAIPGVILTDIVTKHLGALRESAAIALADALTLAMATFRADSAALADALSKAVGTPVADIAGIVDQVAMHLARGSEQDAIGLADALIKAAQKPLVDEAGLGDNIATHSRPAAVDSAALADALVTAVRPAVADIMVVADALAKHAGKADEDEIVGTTDALTKAMRTALADLAGLGDALTTAVHLHRPLPGMFGVGQFDASHFGAGDHTDIIGLADTITAVLARQQFADSLLALADAWAAQTAALRTDQAGLADTLAVAVQRLLAEPGLGLGDAYQSAAAKEAAEAVGITDAMLRALAKTIAELPVDLAEQVAATAAKMLVETLGTEDALTKAFRMAAAHALDLLDQARASILKVVGEQAGLGDMLAAWLVRSLAADDIGLSDALSTQADFERAIADALVLADEITSAAQYIRLAIPPARFGMAEFGFARFDDGDGTDAVTVADHICATIGRNLETATALLDEISVWTAKVAADTAGIGDTYEIRMTKALSAALGLSDSFWAAVSKGAEEQIGLADMLAAATGKPLADTMILTDALVAALHFLRAAADSLGLADAMIRHVNLVCDSILALQDDAWRDIRAARAEALQIADALAKGVMRPLPADAVGIIDEAALLAALGLSEPPTGLEDSIIGEVRRVLSQVFIQGVSVPVIGLTITETSSERVGTCAFRIPHPSEQVRALCHIGATVHAYLFDGGVSITFGGRITLNPLVPTSAVTSELHIECFSYTADAQHVLCNQIYRNKKYTDIVRELWGEFYPYDIDLSGVQDDERTAENWAVIWETLFDATERIANLLGWVWQVEWDGGQRRLRFYAPDTVYHPRSLSWENANIVAGTARFGDDEEIVNAVHVVGGEALSDPFIFRTVANGEATHYTLPHYPFDLVDGPVQVKVNGAAQVVGEETPYWPAGKTALIGREGRFVRFRAPPANGAILEVIYRYGYPIHATMEDEASIAQHGRRERQVVDTKVREIGQARDMARRMLRERAWPTAYGQMEVTEEGIRPGRFVHVYLPDRGIDGVYEITQSSWRVERTVVRRALVLNRSDDPEDRIARKLHEFRLRLEALENADRPANPFIQRFRTLREQQRVRITAVARGYIDIDGASSTGLLLEQAIATLRSGTAVQTRIHEYEVVTEDGIRGHPGKAAADAAGLRELAQVGTHVFGPAALFGGARFGAEVAG